MITIPANTCMAALPTWIVRAGAARLASLVPFGTKTKCTPTPTPMASSFSWNRYRNTRPVESDGRQ
ncbi:MAG TPA: hypothetical protein VGK32_15040 [Vicinamibacterales bacterium]